jgi:hypothetical protein
LGWAKVGDREIEPPLDLPVRVLRQADRARLANAFEPRGDVDAVAHQVPVAFLDDVAQMDADAKLDAPFGRQARIALDQPLLHFDRAAHRVDHAAEFDEAAVAGALDDPPVMGGDRGVNQVAPEAPKARERAILIRSREPAVPDHIGDQDRRNFPGLAHGRAPRPPARLAQKRPEAFSIHSESGAGASAEFQPETPLAAPPLSHGRAGAAASVFASR